MSDIVEKLIRIADASKTQLGADIPLGEQCREAAAKITRLQEQVAAKDKELKDKNHQLTNALYMKDAYRNMLGETGLIVAKMWDEKHVTRVHYDWTGDGYKLTGEQRAAEIIKMEEAADECRGDLRRAKAAREA